MFQLESLIINSLLKVSSFPHVNRPTPILKMCLNVGIHRTLAQTSNSFPPNSQHKKLIFIYPYPIFVILHVFPMLIVSKVLEK